MIIYSATNIVNGKVYIGKTIQPFEKYIKSHVRHALSCSDIKYGKQRAFYAAIRKYGKDSFLWNILCYCSTLEQLNEMEVYFISKFESEYNMTKGGDGGSHICPYERTQEIRDKISLSLKGFKHSKEFSENQSKRVSGENHPLYGIGHKDHSIQKMKENSKGERNGKSQRWRFTSPDGTVYERIGGYKDFINEHDLPRWSMDKVWKGLKVDCKGWRVEKLPS